VWCIIFLVLVVGLTGNYGMGKSSVLSMFGELGALTVDSDEVVRSLLGERGVLDRLRQVLGEAAFDSHGRIVRQKVSDMIFTDPARRRAVEDILHPLVFERVDAILNGARPELAVVEAPLIFERGYEGRFDKTVVVYTSEETALKRLLKAGATRQDALRRLSCQMPAVEKVKRADFAVDNGGTREETRDQVREIFEKLKKEAGG
jgi:dephospho-CoA kinase